MIDDNKVNICRKFCRSWNGYIINVRENVKLLSFTISVFVFNLDKIPHDWLSTRYPREGDRCFCYECESVISLCYNAFLIRRNIPKTHILIARIIVATNICTTGQHFDVH